MDARATANAVPKQRQKRLQVTRVLDNYRWRAQLDQQGYSDSRMQNISHVVNLLTACGTGWLGSHLFACNNCHRRLIGMNHCGNLHCPECGRERRGQWRSDMIQWSLDCNYFHIVFTLPHTLNPLIYTNPKLIYRLLMRTASNVLTRVCKRKLGCTPGLTIILHTFGQRMNLHVHVHIVMTAGGLSDDRTQWINIPDDHPAVHADALADEFKRTFLYRLKRMVRRNLLTWPTIDNLTASHEALGMESYEQTVQFIDPQRTNTPLPPGARRRALTTVENALFDHLSTKQWIAHSQPTPPQFQGAERVINYLSHYVAGSVISDGRLLSDDGTYVTIRIKDYKAGDVKEFQLLGDEFARRFAMHILPRSFGRMRYAGLFMVRDRTQRLAACRLLIGQWKAAQPKTALPCLTALTTSAADEDPATEATHQVPKCLCRYCQGELEVLGRLKGTETQTLKRLAQDIVYRLSLLFVAISVEVNAELLFQLRTAWLAPKRLPPLIRELFRYQRFSSLECGAIEAFVIDEQRKLTEQQPSNSATTLRNGQHQSGIPPPHVNAPEPSHAA